MYLLRLFMFLDVFLCYSINCQTPQEFMTTNSEKNITTLTSICVVILREVRAERGIHQAQVADWIGKTPSAWTKVEAGKSPLQFETFVRVCYSMQVMPSAVMATAERYAALFNNSGWGVLNTELDVSEDNLLSNAQDYWASPGCRNAIQNRWGLMSVLNGPTYNFDQSVSIAAVFQFVLDPDFKNMQLNFSPSTASVAQYPVAGSHSF